MTPTRFVRARRRVLPAVVLFAAALCGSTARVHAQGGPGPFAPQPIGVPDCNAGNTCTSFDNFDVPCPQGSPSPDRWYVFVAPSFAVEVEVCSAPYDTKIYVLDAGFNVVACNDDWCGPNGLQSRLCVTGLTPGDTYFVAVDGAFGDCGSYLLCLNDCLPCSITCTDTEGEPCGTDVNGGCNMPVPQFGAITPGVPACGTAWADAGLRDTDWFQFSHCGGLITWTVDAEFPVVAFILNTDCANIQLLGAGDSGGVCGTAVATYTAPGPGTNRLFLATGGAGGAGIFSGYPCLGGTNAWEALVTVTGTPPPACIETVCGLPCQPRCPTGPVSTRFYTVRNTGTGLPWSWKMVYAGQTTIGACSVPGVTGTAFRVAQRFRDSINAYGVAHGCSSLQATAIALPFFSSTAWLIVQSPSAGAMSLCVGPANTCPACCACLGCPSCPFNPLLDEVDIADVPFLDCDGNGIPDWQDILESGAEDADGDGVPDVCGAPCLWDLDGDGSIAFGDLLVLLAAWGPCEPETACIGDFDADGAVGFGDLLDFLAQWGPCP